MSPPVLSLLPAHRAELTSFFPDTFAAIGRHYTLADAADDDDLAAAQRIAAALAGEVRSSDTDCDYYPCTLAAPELTSDAFFAAVGVPRGTRCEVGGYDNPKLDVLTAGDGDRDGERPGLLIVTWLTGVDLDQIEEYVGDTAPYEHALALLGETGPVHGVQLCTDDGASKVQLTLSRRPSGTYAGVLTVSIET